MENWYQVSLPGYYVRLSLVDYIMNILDRKKRKKQNGVHNISIERVIETIQLSKIFDTVW